ncbi:hypothetical protein OHU34_46200 (plasmid) [Streptomyces sp. NBC_00080]|uniref:hypothetical protein n=1 Tax=Streptomyces sp. NBC_00080 TaxID=2975645 RepID=UPI002F912B4C
MIDSRVWIDTSFGPFPAKVDPADRWNNSLRPRFTLDTVREVAARTQEMAEVCGYESVDTAHVIDGDTLRGGPRAVVLFVTWRHYDANPEEVTHVITPDEEGLYTIGAGCWAWGFVPWKCVCGFRMDWHVARCPACRAPRDKEPPYLLPDPATISTAAHAAVSASQTASESLGRVMAVVTAAAVRDILTGHDANTRFDAARLELLEGSHGALSATGRYWTVAGEERTFARDVGDTDAGNALHDMNEWVAYLGDSNYHVWRPLCDELPDRDRRPAYALDLVKAAQLLTP